MAIPYSSTRGQFAQVSHDILMEAFPVSQRGVGSHLPVSFALRRRSCNAHHAEPLFGKNFRKSSMRKALIVLVVAAACSRNVAIPVGGGRRRFLAEAFGTRLS